MNEAPKTGAADRAALIALACRLTDEAAAFQDARAVALIRINEERAAEGLEPVASENGVWSQVMARAVQYTGHEDPATAIQIHAGEFAALICREARAAAEDPTAAPFPMFAPAPGDALRRVPEDREGFVRIARRVADEVRRYYRATGDAHRAALAEWQAQGLSTAPDYLAASTGFHYLFRRKCLELAGCEYPDASIIEFGAYFAMFIADAFQTPADGPEVETEALSGRELFDALHRLLRRGVTVHTYPEDESPEDIRDRTRVSVKWIPRDDPAEGQAYTAPRTAEADEDGKPFADIDAALRFVLRSECRPAYTGGATTSGPEQKGNAEA